MNTPCEKTSDLQEIKQTLKELSADIKILLLWKQQLYGSFITISVLASLVSFASIIIMRFIET